jgi:uncharacterized membrane protein
MPHHWTPAPAHHDRTQPITVLTLWPHRSLPPRGFAAIIMMAFLLITVPLFGLLGTVLLWGLLPFMLMAVGALWWGLRRSYRDGYITETLTHTGDMLTLTHETAKGEIKDWECNIYWARCEIHLRKGPVPHYVTLTGNGRTVEIGAFLSEDERKVLFTELQDFLKNT